MPNHYYTSQECATINIDRVTIKIFEEKKNTILAEGLT